MSDVLSHDREPKVDAFLIAGNLDASEPDVRQLFEAAQEHNWPCTTRLVRRKDKLHTSAAVSDNDNGWYRLLIDGVDGTNVTIDVQPMFTDNLRFDAGIPQFVRKYDGRGGIAPGLHALLTTDAGTEFRSYALPDTHPSEDTSYLPAQEMSVARWRIEHQSILDFLHQHDMLSHLGQTATDYSLPEQVYSD